MRIFVNRSAGLVSPGMWRTVTMPAPRSSRILNILRSTWREFWRGRAAPRRRRGHARRFPHQVGIRGRGWGGWGFQARSSSNRSHTPRAPSAARPRHPAHHDCHPVTSDAIFTNRIQIGGSVITALPIMTEPTPHAEHVAACGMHAGPTYFEVESSARVLPSFTTMSDSSNAPSDTSHTPRPGYGNPPLWVPSQQQSRNQKTSCQTTDPRRARTAPLHPHPHSRAASPGLLA